MAPVKTNGHLNLCMDVQPLVVFKLDFYEWILLNNEDVKGYQFVFAIQTLARGRSSVIRELEFKSEDPGFDTLAGQGENQVFCPSESTLFVSLLNV